VPTLKPDRNNRQSQESISQANIDTIRSAYRARRDAMLAALEAICPKGVSWTKPEGGMFQSWVTLPDTLDGAELLKQSAGKRTGRLCAGPCVFRGRVGGAITLRLSYRPRPKTTDRSG